MKNSHNDKVQQEQNILDDFDNHIHYQEQNILDDSDNHIHYENSDAGNLGKVV